MIEIYGDYHTHTIYSHGTGTIMDNVVAARKKGLREIAITDHGLRHFAYGVRAAEIAKMREEIDRINENSEGIRVLLGMECNIISIEGDIDLRDEVRKYLDIVLLGYHMMVIPKTFGDAVSIYGKNYAARAFHSIAERVMEANTKAMIKAINKHKIDVITHPGARIAMDTTELAREAVRVGTALEINAHSSFMDAGYVRAAQREGVSFIINSDAHSPADIGNFARGIKIAEEAGLDASHIINARK